MPSPLAIVSRIIVAELRNSGASNLWGGDRIFRNVAPEVDASGNPTAYGFIVYGLQGGSATSVLDGTAAIVWPTMRILFWTDAQTVRDASDGEEAIYESFSGGVWESPFGVRSVYQGPLEVTEVKNGVRRDARGGLFRFSIGNANEET